MRPRRLRTLVPALGLIGIAAFAPLPATAQDAAADRLRVYVVVVDGLNVEELDGTPPNGATMPFLASLAAAGTYYTEARSVMIAETTPNHVAMVTGVYPDKNGIVSNDYPDLETGEAAENGNPELLEADSLFTLVQEQCPQLETAAVTSKDYLYWVMDHDRTGDGRVDADYNFANEDHPLFIPSPASLTPDEVTITEALRVVDERDPDFLFVNLGAVDRVGHADVVGGATTPTGSRPVARDVQRTNTDTYLRAFVEGLKQTGRWENSALIVTADHSMDWSLPTSTVSLMPAFEDDPLLQGQVVFATNGGAGLYSLLDRDAEQADARLAKMREIAVATAGVDEALYREPNPLDGGEEHWVGAVHPDWHQTHPRSGDLLVTVEDGLRVTEPGPFDNPIPGNHGMTSTVRIPLVVAGGLPVVQQRVTGSDDPNVRADDQAENVDVAPTVAWLMGIAPPEDGFDGRVLSEAFAAQPEAVCVEPASTSGPAPGPTPVRDQAAPTTVARELAATGPLLLVPAAGVALAAAVALAARRRR